MVKRKKKSLQLSKDERLVGRELYKDRVPRSFLYFVMLLIPVSVVSGVFIGVEYSHPLSFNGNQNPGVETIEVGKYTVTLLPSNHSLMKGDTIGADIGRQDFQFYIEKSLSKNTLESTCVHERLHDMGLPGGNSTAHKWIDLHEDDIDDYVCNKLIEKLEKRNFFY